MQVELHQAVAVEVEDVWPGECLKLIRSNYKKPFTNNDTTTKCSLMAIPKPFFVIDASHVKCSSICKRFQLFLLIVQE